MTDPLRRALAEPMPPPPSAAATLRGDPPTHYECQTCAAVEPIHEAYRCADCHARYCRRCIGWHVRTLASGHASGWRATSARTPGLPPCVVPVADIRPHDTDSPACWCRPVMRYGALVHRSEDQREMAE